ncbi:MAG: Kelch repeat-containing protein [Rhodothalassiaceae bacterium]
MIITRRTAMIGAAAAALASGRSGRAAAGGGWSPGPALPIATQEVYPTEHQGLLYLAGGIASWNAGPFISARVDIYDPAGKAWSRGPDLPQARHHVTLLSTGETLYAIGGHYGAIPGGLWQMRDTVWTLAKDGWADGVALPQPQAEMTSAVLDGRLHLVGGRHIRASANQDRSDHGDVTDHLVFDPDTNRWQRAAPASRPRNSAAGGVLRGRFHIVGGRQEADNMTLHEAYDPMEDKWFEMAPLPKPQAGLAGAVLDGMLYVFGGEIFQPRRGVFAEAWMYDLMADRWQPIADLPTPRHGLGAVRLGEAIHVVAGATEPGGSGRSPAHEIYRAG